ncbi:MAG: magnesium transporter [Candidatus Pacearchaeota archaeon]
MKMITKELKKYLQDIRKLEREKNHDLIHKVHKKHGISKQTLFYVKEYGKSKNVSGTIIKESIKILILASIISSFGGFALNSIETLFLSIFPLVLLLPALNNMVGNYATVVSSRFSEMLYDGKVKKKWWKTPDLRKLFSQILIMAIFASVLSSLVAIGITYFSPEGIVLGVAIKVFLIVFIDMILLTNILFLVAVFSGLYFYKKNEDPNNFLIPITTGVADFSNMVVLAVLVVILF